MNSPRISLIVPAHNYARFLPRCLDAIFSQTAAPLEVIVVDDGSTDDTRAVCLGYGDRLRYHYQANRGLSGARNAGVQIAAGDWFLFCDADDRLRPRALEALSRCAEAPSTGVVYGKCIEFFEDGRTGAVMGDARAAGPPPLPTRANFWKSIIATSGAALVRRTTFEKVGGYAEPFVICEDREFWIKAGMYADFAFCDEIVLEKSTRSDSLVSRKGLMIYWPMMFQLRFLDWCLERGLDSSPLDVTPARIVANAYQYTIAGAHPGYLWKCRQEARRRGVQRPGAREVLATIRRHGVPAWLQLLRGGVKRVVAP